ncbi:MAG: hypothetical protein V4492_06570 [Chlamydiota bacterium]
MTTVTLDAPLGPVSQIGQVFCAVATFLRSLVERTDTAFCRVVVHKTDVIGRVRTFPTVLNAETGVIERNTNRLYYIEDRRTGDLYKDENWLGASSKCFMLALGNPILFTGKLAWKLIKTPFEIASVASDALGKVRDLYREGRAVKSFCALFHAGYAITAKTTICLYDIVRIPLFAVGVELGALYGIVRPFHGRKIFAMIENAWHKGVSHRQDCLRGNNNCARQRTCTDMFHLHFGSDRPFYMAYCFQKRGNVKNPDIIVIERKKL